MLTSAGNSGSSEACSLDMIQLHVRLLTGPYTTLGRMGREARQLVSKQVERRKFKLTLLHTASALVPHQTLQQQGILGQEAAVNCPFVPIDWCAAWCCV